MGPIMSQNPRLVLNTVVRWAIWPGKFSSEGGRGSGGTAIRGRRFVAYATEWHSLAILGTPHPLGASLTLSLIANSNRLQIPNSSNVRWQTAFADCGSPSNTRTDHGILSCLLSHRASNEASELDGGATIRPMFSI